jgi:choline monooxygenase
VWVHQGEPVVPLNEWVAPLAKHGFAERMSPLRFVTRREYPLACDWKVFCDNYLDGGYHINSIHPALAGVLDYSQYRTEFDGSVSVQISPLTQRKGAESVAAVRGGENAYYAWIFPNVMINIYDQLMDTNIVLPDGPGRCRVVFDYYFANIGDDSRQFIDDSIAVTHQVQLEDGDICEDVQRGLTSGAFDVGRFSARREGAGYHFHQLLAQKLRG